MRGDVTAKHCIGEAEHSAVKQRHSCVFVLICFTQRRSTVTKCNGGVGPGYGLGGALLSKARGWAYWLTPANLQTQERQQMITIRQVKNGWILCLDSDWYGPEYVYNRPEDLIADLTKVLIEPPAAERHPCSGNARPEAKV